MCDHYDVIIIGTGAGGGTLAHRLAPTGKRVLLLERGGYLPARARELGLRGGLRQGALRHHRALVRQARRAVPPARAVLRRRQHQGLRRDPLPPARARLRRGPATTAASRPRGRSSYADLEPYYAEAERLYLVHGAARRGPDRAAGAPGPFPHPAVSHEPRIQQLARRLRAAGPHPFHLPVGVDLDESDPENGRCVRCDRFDGFPCLTDGKSDAHVRCVRPALEHDNVTLAPTRRSSGWRPMRPAAACHRVVVERRGREETYSARRRRRLLRRGQLGGAAAALRERPPPERARELLRRRRPPLHGPHQLGRDRDLADAERRRSSRRRSASTTTTWGATTPSSRSGTSRCSASPTATSCARARRGSRPALALDYMAKHAIDFWLTTEDLPHPDNRVTVDRRGNIHLAKTYHNHEAHRRLLAQAQGPARPPLGCHERADPALVGARPAHPARRHRPQLRHGALRRRPATSALDVDCKAHDLDNLYVVDTSFFPSSSAVNPALTAMANALRVGDHLIERLGAPRDDPGDPGMSKLAASPRRSARACWPASPAPRP